MQATAGTLIRKRLNTTAREYKLAVGNRVLFVLNPGRQKIQVDDAQRH